MEEELPKCAKDYQRKQPTPVRKERYFPLLNKVAMF